MLILLPQKAKSTLKTENEGPDTQGEALVGLVFGYLFIQQSTRTCIHQLCSSEWSEARCENEFHNKKAPKQGKQGLLMQPSLS